MKNYILPSNLREQITNYLLQSALPSVDVQKIVIALNGLKEHGDDKPATEPAK